MWGKNASNIVRPAIRQRVPAARRAYNAGRSSQAAVALKRSVVAEVPDFQLPRAVADEKRVAVSWSPDKQSRFHHMWLRDHCRCPECFHPVTKQRMLDTFSIPADIQPRAVDATEAGLRISWPSTDHTHTSLYPWNWLKDHTYDPRGPSIKQDWQIPITWNSWKMKQETPYVTYDAVMNDDMAVYDWLVKINKWGLCFVEGVPADIESTEVLATRIAFIRETQYGKMWSFTSDLKHGDTAYTNIALPAHTDNTYFTDPAGLQIFHLLDHPPPGEGGATLLIDGFYVAQQVKERFPDSFDLLTRIPISCHAAGDADSFYRPNPESGYPVLALDPWTGDVRHVRWNNNDRSAVNLPPNIIESWYQAIRDWNTCLTEKESEFWVQMKPGLVVVIDNQRVLHGRGSFTGKRTVCGAYLGKDDFLSRLRVLHEKAEKGSHEEGGVPKASDSPGSKQSESSRSVWAPGL